MITKIFKSSPKRLFDNSRWVKCLRGFRDWIKYRIPSYANPFPFNFNVVKLSKRLIP